MGVIYRELFVLLAIIAVARSEPIANKTSKKDVAENLSYQYEDYDASEDQEEILFSEDKPCPRDCICTVSQGYRIANCNRLEVGTQKFGDDITDLVLENIDPKHSIELDDEIFKKLGLHQITTVKIVNSTISTVSPTAFHGLHELYAVNLSGNRLKTIHPDTFAKNKKLLLLTLANNPLKFPAKGSYDYFLNSTSVQELDISNCNMQYITAKTFSQMPGLMYLNIGGNHLSNVDKDAFKNLPDLEELDLSDNELMSLPGDIFSANSELGTLHIQRNPIDTVYGLQITDLLTLNAGQTMIKFVGPSMFNGMTYIANLNLSGNGIQKIHNQAFHKLLELNYLDLSYNDLDFMSNILIKENIELDIFKIANNPKLKKLPENGFECSAEQFNIYLFDAANCGLEEIPKNALSTFSALTQINLSGNKLKYLSEYVFTRCPRLVEMNLADNSLTILDDKIFAQNKDLNKLNLKGNPLKVLSLEIFIYTPQLTWLDLSHNQLDTLWEENKTHPAALLNNLQFLNISNNQLTQIKNTELESIKKLSTLDINNNPLQCDREFENLITLLVKRKISPAAQDIIISNLEQDAKEETRTYSWEFLTRKVCKTDMNSIGIYDKSSTTVAPASDEEIWEKIEKSDSDKFNDELSNTFEYTKDNLDDNDADDEEDDDDDEDEDYDNDIDLDVKLIESAKNNGSKKTIVATPKSSEGIEIKVKLLEDDEVYDVFEEPMSVQTLEEDVEHGHYEYLWPILIVLLGALLLLIVIGKVVMVICNKRTRQTRYNSAIIAAMSNQGRTKKDCGLVYQQLSEDLTGPTTPKLNRYAPLHNTLVKTSNVSYESSPFHHNNIVPEAV